MTSDNGRVPVVLSVQVYPAPLQARLGHALVTSDLHLSRFINVPGDDGILTDVVDIEGRETPGGDIGEVVQMLEQCAVVSRDVLSVIDSVLVPDPQHYFTCSIIIFVLSCFLNIIYPSLYRRPMSSFFGPSCFCVSSRAQSSPSCGAFSVV